jgi:23S rRNA pseudouridine2605 synthase
LKERVQKIIAERGVCSRRAAEKLIEEGKVRVNGRKVEIGASCDSKDLITVDGKKIAPSREKQAYILLNKPRGYVTTASDEKGRKTVMELLEGVEERVYPVGRLDMASEGLLLLTNDGELARFLMHPSSGVEKEYQVTVLGDAESALAKLEAGVLLDDGYKTSPAKARIVKKIDEKTVISVIITEGHNRQVRKMCEAIGLTVRRLVRVSEGKLKLGDLRSGKWRPALPSEVKYLTELLKGKDGEEEKI